jgi:hypothetical protein
MKCEKCGNTIPKERAKFLNEFGRPPHCASCSEENKTMTLMEYSHKTAGEIVIVPNDPEAKRKAMNAYRRTRP